MSLYEDSLKLYDALGEKENREFVLHSCVLDRVKQVYEAQAIEFDRKMYDMEFLLNMDYLDINNIRTLGKTIKNFSGYINKNRLRLIDIMFETAKREE